MNDTVKDALRVAAPSLLIEYRRLMEARRLHGEDEPGCQSLDRTNLSRGAIWRQYDISADHHPLDPQTRCSVDAPVACGLLEEMRDTHGLRIQKVAYSAVAAGGHIRPHWGVEC